jgi:hypothetical protein
MSSKKTPENDSGGEFDLRSWYMKTIFCCSFYELEILQIISQNVINPNPAIPQITRTVKLFYSVRADMREVMLFLFV